MTSARSGFCRNGPRYGRQVGAARLEQSAAPAEGALSDGVDDDVVPLRVVGEVLGLVVDDPVGAQPTHHLQLRGRARGGHIGAERLEELDRCGADGARRAVNEDVLANAHLGPPDGRLRIVRPLGARGRHLERHSVGDGGDGGALADRDVLGVTAEADVVVAEHAVADVEPRHGVADGLDHSGELAPEHRVSGAAQPREEPHDEGLRRSESAVRPVDRRRVHPDEERIGPDSRHLDVLDMHDLRRAVARRDGRPHSRTLGPPALHMGRALTASGAARSVIPQTIAAIRC